MITRIRELLGRCDSPWPPMPATILYNEGWLLRLVLSWCAEQEPDDVLQFASGARWYSEGLLRSPFPRTAGSGAGEGYTHVDGIVGHFDVDPETTARIKLAPEASQLLVLEAKMYSPLSRGVTHAPGYDQAARTVACMAQLLCDAQRHPSTMEDIRFVVVAPGEQVKREAFERLLEKDSIQRRVLARAKGFRSQRTQRWLREWFEPTLARMDCYPATWEWVIGEVESRDASTGQGLRAFYERCLTCKRRKPGSQRPVEVSAAQASGLPAPR